jgi:hypothetical protein
LCVLDLSGRQIPLGLVHPVRRLHALLPWPSSHNFGNGGTVLTG